MILDNVWNGWLWILGAIFLVVGFGTAFTYIMASVDTNVKVFVGVIVCVVMLLIAFKGPIMSLIGDDEGNIN